jgi:RNA polymerase sigma factor (sigma-70 family)
MAMSLSDDTSRDVVFATTQWTRVLAARGESLDARAALSDLCEAYYQPVLAFIRSWTRDDDRARDLTHDFFSRLLGGKGVSGVDPQRGRFRSFLLGAAKHFLSDVRDRDLAARRGGQYEHLPLKPETDTSPGTEPPDPRTPQLAITFDREWALTILNRALDALASQQKEHGQSRQFEVLKPWLTGDLEQQTQAAAAAQLGMNEGAVKVAIHRLRRQFRELVKREIAQTLDNPAQVNDELGYLISILA